MSKKKYRNKQISEAREVSPGIYEAEYIREEIPAAEQEQPNVPEQVMFVAPAMPAAEPVVEKVDFDAWFVMRGKKIPAQHHKEIVRADFKGRGLGQCESLEDFDAALRKYGVKLV